MTFPVQKSFGTFIAERYGPKWVYAHRRSERIARQYPNSAVITPKQQRELARDYKLEWGAEHDPAAWKALCALRFVKMELDTAGIKRAKDACSASYDEVREAIEALTT